MVGKKLRFEEISGNVFNLGSERKNVGSVRRRLVNRGFKGRFLIRVGKTPKRPGEFVKFSAVRKVKK